jgi:RNA polymerase sigma-70 factor (ECF subfamily)
VKDAEGAAALPRDASDVVAGSAVKEHEERLTAILESYDACLRGAVARCCPRTLGLDTADIEQEARIRVWNALRREKEIANLPSYLYRVAATATIDAVRRLKARREDPLPESAESEALTAARPSSGPSPERLARDKEIADVVKRAIDRLEEKRRRVVQLHLQGFGAEEVAQLLGWSEPKARNLIYRGLANLRHELQELGMDSESL